MTYAEFAATNQELYAELEMLTVEIMLYAYKGQHDLIYGPDRRRQQLKELIEFNLTQIEDIWEAEKLRCTTVAVIKTKPTSLQKRVIDLYLELENNHIENIAKVVDINPSAVNSIITTFLRNGYQLNK